MESNSLNSYNLWIEKNFSGRNEELIAASKHYPKLSEFFIIVGADPSVCPEC